MGRDFRVFSRRTWLATLLAAPAARAQASKSAAFPAEARRYSDPVTEFEVLRLTDPSFASQLSAPYNRDISRGSSFLIYSSARSGSFQACRMDLKTGQIHQLTEAESLDPASLTMTPDNRAFCYAAGGTLFFSSLVTLRERELYPIPDGWERCPGLSVGPDGTHALIAEQKGDSSRLRLIPLVPGAARTVVEAPFAMSHAQARPMRAQAFYRQGNDALWLVNLDGQQNRKLKLAPGRVGSAQWTNDGKTILYLNIPEDPAQLNAIREFTPDTNTDKLVAKTSQYASFGFNRDSSVFVGASANRASPAVLILLRVTRRELTLCEHKTSDPAAAAPRFSPDSQRIYFQSDREGKPAIYCMHVEKLVEKTESETK
jgi:oligogalacturonide lyase